MATSCIIEEDSVSDSQTVTDEFIKEVVTEKQLIENSDSCEYIECTPLLLGISLESERSSTSNDGTHTKKLQCPQCEYKTRRRDLLLSHTMLHEKETSLSVKGQQQTARSFTLLQRGEQFFYKCIKCFYMTAAWPEIKRHVRRKHTGDSAYGCDWCTEYTSPNLAQLKWHVERQHWRNLPYRCENCKYTCWHLRELQIHKVKHYPIPVRLSRSHCDIESSDRKELNPNRLKDHSATYHNDCNRCVNNNSIDCHKTRLTNRIKNTAKRKNI